MAAEFETDLFEKLQSKLEKHKGWHTTQYELYGGKWTPSSLGISVSPELDAKIEVYLDLSRIEIDYLANQMNFDVLIGDEWNLIDYLEMGNCDRVFRSLIKNSMIGSCAFVSITPGNVENGEPPVVYTPYTGYEATGILNSRTGKLDAGIAIDKYNDDGTAKSYLLFLPDGTYEYIDGNIERIYESKTGVQLVPFVYDQDLASRPFGRARTSSAQRTIAGSAIRTLKRAELSSEFFASPLRYIFTKADEDGSENILEVWNSTIGALLEMQTENGVDHPEMGQLASSSPEPFIKQFNMFIEQYAANAAMSPQEFGVAPSNGALSADAEAERSKKMKDLLAECQSAYGDSIKQVAIHTASILGLEIVPEMYRMKTAWVQTTLDSDLGKIGDALGKLFAAIPDLQNTDIAFEKLGISKRSRIDRTGGLPDSSPAKRLTSLSDELKQIITDNSNDPENRISGLAPSDTIDE